MLNISSQLEKERLNENRFLLIKKILSVIKLRDQK
jgi:hypothetical protein